MEIPGRIHLSDRHGEGDAEGGFQKMSNRLFTSASIVAVIASALAMEVPAVGQAPGSKTASAKYAPPRTPWGHPDLRGTYSNSTVVPLERPDNAKQGQLTDAEVEERFQKHRKNLFAKREGDTGFYNEFWWEWGKDNNRTSLIVDPPDGKLPVKPGVRERNKALATIDKPATWEDMNVFDRCITRSLPGSMLPGFYGHYYQILQTPDYVVLRIELIHDVRIIPLDNRPHLGQNIRQWLGDSRGRWDGDTLVVETTNLNDKVKAWGGTYFGAGADFKLVERFRRADANTIDYQFTVEAPSMFTRPWTVALPLWHTDDKIFEYACHEGNYAMPHSLSGTRAMEGTSAGKK